MIPTSENIEYLDSKNGKSSPADADLEFIARAQARSSRGSYDEVAGGRARLEREVACTSRANRPSYVPVPHTYSTPQRTPKPPPPPPPSKHPSPPASARSPCPGLCHDAAWRPRAAGASADGVAELAAGVLVLVRRRQRLAGVGVGRGRGHGGRDDGRRGNRRGRGHSGGLAGDGGLAGVWVIFKYARYARVLCDARGTLGAAAGEGAIGGEVGARAGAFVDAHNLVGVLARRRPRVGVGGAVVVGGVH
ncbi:hypothetical protein C8J57DRAFT_1472379 [Mycena rebaudengoi]|nr:hypothetical protein C8J57DRAFT_1472379 [Mycena rebaudengoi]